MPQARDLGADPTAGAGDGGGGRGGAHLHDAGGGHRGRLRDASVCAGGRTSVPGSCNHTRKPSVLQQCLLGDRTVLFARCCSAANDSSNSHAPLLQAPNLLESAPPAHLVMLRTRGDVLACRPLDLTRHQDDAESPRRVPAGSPSGKPVSCHMAGHGAELCLWLCGRSTR